MKISITEALRLKNEVSGIVNKMNYKINQSVFGTTTEDGVVISSNGTKFTEVNEAFKNALKYSESINNAISEFNRDNKVDAHVRKMHNAKLLADIYQNNLGKTKPNSFSKWETGAEHKRQAVEVVYTPEITGKEMKNMINEQKSIARNAQKDIEALNQKEIDIDFSYEDVEALNVE